MPYLGDDGQIHNGEALPAQVDPVPTMFGTGRIASQEGDNGAAELSKAILWINQRARRYGFEAFLESTLISDPVLAQNRRADLQPLIDFFDDMEHGEGDNAIQAAPYIGNVELNP